MSGNAHNRRIAQRKSAKTNIRWVDFGNRYREIEKPKPDRISLVSGRYALAEKISPFDYKSHRCTHQELRDLLRLAFEDQRAWGKTGRSRLTLIGGRFDGQLWNHEGFYHPDSWVTSYDATGKVSKEMIGFERTDGYRLHVDAQGVNELYFG